MKKSLYALEYKVGDSQIIVFNCEGKRDSIFLTHYEAKVEKHNIFQYYKTHYPQEKYKFRDFKIVKYIQERKENK